jgi:hypothetical protein
MCGSTYRVVIKHMLGTHSNHPYDPAVSFLLHTDELL